MLTCIALHFKIVLVLFSLIVLQVAFSYCPSICEDHPEQMNQTIQAGLEPQQTSMLEKLSSIMNNKLESMKRQLEEASNTQMSELKEIRLTESQIFKMKLGCRYAEE